MVLSKQPLFTTLHQAMRALLLIILVGAFAYFPKAKALDKDNNQPIHLEADSANINDNEGVHEYQGNVSITQGSMQIAAHKVTVIFQNKDVDQFIAIGNQQTPAYMAQILHDDRQPVEAWAQQINYDTDQALITLQGAARLRQEGNDFFGETITFSTENETLMLKSNPDANDRVKLTILPDS